MKMGYIRTYAPFAAVAVLLLAGLFLFELTRVHARHDVLMVAFLDVGQGDAILIETPRGRRVLVDGGNGLGVLQELGILLPFSVRTLDMVVATHPDLDHIGSLPEVFTRYTVGRYLDPGVADEGADYAALLAAVADEGLEPEYALAGQRYALDSGVYLEVLFPERTLEHADANRGSIVMRLVYGDTSFVLMGDAPASVERYLAAHARGSLEGDVLKLGHHGSRTSSSEELLKAVAPEYAVVSAGCDNRYGHPHADVLERVRAHGAEIRGTCEDGTVVFESDGASVTLR